MPCWLTVGKVKKWKWEGGKTRRDQQDGQQWQKRKLCRTRSEKNREVGLVVTQKEIGHKQIGGSVRGSEIAAAEIRGSKRQMRHRHRNRQRIRKESRKNCQRHWWSKKRLEGERFGDNAIERTMDARNKRGIDYIRQWWRVKTSLADNSRCPTYISHLRKHRGFQVHLRIWIKEHFSTKKSGILQAVYLTCIQSVWLREKNLRGPTG